MSGRRKPDCLSTSAGQLAGSEGAAFCWALAAAPTSEAAIAAPVTMTVCGAFQVPLVNVTDAGATLGRVLFYDRRLSANDTVACASCHNERKAFTDGRTLARGVAISTNEAISKAHAPVLPTIQLSVGYLFHCARRPLYTPPPCPRPS